MIIKHTHQMRRLRRSGNIFICDDSHCTYKIEDSRLLEGKASLCNKCHSEFVLTREDLKRSRPVCLNCSNTKEAIEFRERKKQIESVLGNL